MSATLEKRDQNLHTFVGVELGTQREHQYETPKRVEHQEN